MSCRGDEPATSVGFLQQSSGSNVMMSDMDFVGMPHATGIITALVNDDSDALTVLLDSMSASDYLQTMLFLAMYASMQVRSMANAEGMEPAEFWQQTVMSAVREVQEWHDLNGQDDGPF